MQPFETTIITRGQQVEIRANINPSEHQYAAFLKHYNQQPPQFLKNLYEKLQYSGSQLPTSLIFLIAMSGSEIYNLFSYSYNKVFEISIVGCLLYCLLFTSILNFKKQIIVQILFFCLSIGLLAFSLLTSMFNTYVAAGIIFSIFTCLLCKIARHLLEYNYSDIPTPKFAFQSNLLLFQFIVWKVFQICLDYLSLNTFNFHSLLTTLIALAVVNSVKIYKLFDYEVFQVLSIFKEKYEKPQNDDNKAASMMVQSISILLKNQKEEKDQQQTQKPLQKQELLINEGQEIHATSIVKMDETSIANENRNKSDRIIQQEDKTYESSVRILSFIIFSLANVAYLLYIIIKKQYNDSSFKTNLLWHSISFLRTTILIVTCEYQKLIRGQVKDLPNYFFIFICDLSWLISSAAMMLLPSIISISYEQAFMLSMVPLVTIKIFNFLDKRVHLNLNNNLYLSLVVLWLIPISFREIGYVQNLQIITKSLDLISFIYAVFVLLVWSNKDNIVYFIKQVKKVFVSKKDRLKVFQKLKTCNFQYSQILQSYFYMHIIYLNLAYYWLSDLSDLVKIIYLIIYFSPALLYLLALINCQAYSISIPQSYRPSMINVIISALCLVYAVVSQEGILPQNHSTWSLIVLLNVALFVLALQGQKLAIVYFPAFKNFLRTLVISILFLFMYLPFIVGFTSGYFITKFSQDYLFYYSLVGFFYIWLVITIVGMGIHWILNLTQKSKKELFVARYMQGQMKKINMKENIEKILMIYNMFELFNYKTQELLTYLRSQQHMAIVVRKEKEFEYDYELIEPEEKEKRRLTILAKPMKNVFDIAKLVSPTSQQVQSDVEELKENPVLIFFKEKERNKIQISTLSDNNNNITELKRMIARKNEIPTNQKEIQKSQEWKQMVTASNEAIAEYMAKLFHFLTQPSKLISRQTFAAFLTLLTREQQTIEASNKVYDKFSSSGLMDEYKFKSFILDYVNYKYQVAHDTLASLLRTFCCKDLVPLLLTNFGEFKYYIFRKKLSSTESSQVWLKDKVVEENNAEYNLMKKRQAKKKAKLLRKSLAPKKNSNNNKDQEVQQQGDQPQEIPKPRYPTLIKADKKELKDKKFMKPENVYAVLVNSLIQCNLYYEKQAQNFKIKTIKFTISNLLAIITKINDIVFVFGYSTIYLFIAYYKNSFGDTYPIYSTVNYNILLIASVSLVFIYIILIVYHKSDFEKGTLGLDQNQRSLDFKNVKFYTTTVLFLLGSSLANYILSIGLNSFICNQNTSKLYNFSDQSCYNSFQYGYMLSSLLILVIYWPLSAITFPFSTAMNRDLQIKYKAEYQILYLQFKFLINGFNTLLNPYPYQTQQLINSISKVIICSTLALLYNQMQPCSYELLNRIEGKIYIILTLLSFSGALCYFVGLFYSIIITGSILGLYLVYFIYATIKSYTQLTNDNQENQILQDNIKNQKIKIQIIKQANKAELQNEGITLQTLRGKEKNKSGEVSQGHFVSQTRNSSQGQTSHKNKKTSAKRNGFF